MEWVQVAFYLGILCVLVHVGRNVYLAWRDDEFGDEDLIERDRK